MLVIVVLTHDNVEVNNWKGKIEEECAIVGADGHVVFVRGVEMDFLHVLFAEEVAVVDGDVADVVAFVNTSEA